MKIHAPNTNMPFHQCFETLRAALQWAADMTGAEGNMIVGAHLFKTVIGKAEGVSILNTEVVDPESSWFKSGAYPEMCSRYRMFDYSKENIEAWKKHYDIDVEHLPIGYSPTMYSSRLYDNRPSSPEGRHPVFYGSLNERRIDFIERSDVTVLKFGTFGEDLEIELGRASVVANIHFYESAIFEIVRCCELFANAIPVLSERSVDEYSYPIEDLFHDKEEIIRRVNERDIPDGMEQFLQYYNRVPRLFDTFNRIDFKW